MAAIEVVEGDGDAEDDFSRFRDKVAAAINDSIDHYTVPLCVDHGKKTIANRSGVLLQIADMHFLVTAGHDMVELLTEGHSIGIAMPVKGSHAILLTKEKFWTTKDKQEDISVTQLTPPVVAYIKDHYRYVRLTSLMSRDDPSQGKGMYLIYGFPDAIVGPDDEGDTAVESWWYLTVRYRGEYSNVEDYNPRLHFVLDYERNTHNKDGVRVHPPGMSGCGIWFVGHPHTHSLFNADDFKLVAIQNRWHKGYEYAKGTWIDNVLLILWKYYPDTHKPMQLQGIDFTGR